nr:retrovirus-related Pol polyprotein from transposon TNT 1-94 [Tanacetum cinerariifolium]
MSNEDWLELDKKALATVQLFLTQEVLREVIHETTTTGLWLKLESLYMIKSLANNLRLKDHLYTFRMKPCTSVQDHLDEFNTILIYLENLDVDIESVAKISLERKGKGNNEKKLEKAAEVAIAKGDSDSDVYLAIDTKKSRDELIVDSGCTFHLISYRSWFNTYESFNGGNVYMGNHSNFPVIGKGNIQVKMHDGVVRTITGVWHVPDLKRNLISLSTLEANGCKYSGEVYGTAGVALSKANLDDSKLCHYRLGHIGEKGMKNLAKKGLIKVSCNLEFYEHCVFGQQKKVSFSPGIHRTRDALDYIHSDLWGPSHVTSRGGKKIKKLRTDNGLEFCGKSCNALCRKVFGCPVYVHVNEGKLVPRAVKCIFLGYSSGVKDFVPPHNVDNNHIEGKVEFEFDVENSIHTQPPFNDEHIETQDDGNMPTSPQSQPQTEYLLARDHERQQVNRPPRLKDYQCDLFDYAFSAVMAMGEEVKSLHKNGTWEQVKLRKEKRVISCKWLFKGKDGIHRFESNRYKVRYVVRGFDQREGIDFNEVFSLVVRHTSIRVLLSIVALQNLELEQLDIKTTFLHGHLEEDIYVEQPKGFKVSEKEYHVAPHFKLSSHECPKFEEDKKDMSRVPYSNAVGSLMYTMVCTHPDLSYAKGRASPNGVVGYVDSDYESDLDARKSISSYIFSHCGSAISWYSSLQAITVLSTTEVEYISSTEGVKEAIWLQGMVNEFGLPQELELLVFDTLRGAATTTMKSYGFWFKVEIVEIMFQKL